MASSCEKSCCMESDSLWEVTDCCTWLNVHQQNRSYRPTHITFSRASIWNPNRPLLIFCWSVHLGWPIPRGRLVGTFSEIQIIQTEGFFICHSSVCWLCSEKQAEGKRISSTNRTLKKKKGICAEKTWTKGFNEGLSINALDVSACPIKRRKKRASISLSCGQGLQPRQSQREQNVPLMEHGTPGHEMRREVLSEHSSWRSGLFNKFFKMAYWD